MQRIYFLCSSCRLGEYPLDEKLGVGDTLAPGARRMGCLASTLGGSFARGAELLMGLAGWTVSDETLSQVCYREGQRMKAWRFPEQTLAQPHTPEVTEPAADAGATAPPGVAPELAAGGAAAEPAAAAAEPPVPQPDAVEPLLGSSRAAGGDLVAELAAHFPDLAEALAKANAAEAVRRSHAAPAPPGSEVGVAASSAPAAAESAETPEAESFRKAKGEIELQIDAGKVNTTERWRDIKVAVFAKREQGEPCPPEKWAKRELPRPTARVAFTAIDTSANFGPECRDWAGRLGVRETSKISVIGDGADWIWTLVVGFLCGARQLLDIFHAAEHVAKASKALFGAGTPEAKAWQDRVMLALLSGGWLGLCREVGEVLAQRRDPAAQEALDALLGYFAPRLYLLDYLPRLQHGEAIGSGMVEGCVKTMINKRLKANGARWQVKNVIRMAELCSLHYSDSWTQYWMAV